MLVVGPTNGTLTLNGDGSFIYTPNVNFNGSDLVHLQGQRRHSGLPTSPRSRSRSTRSTTRRSPWMMRTRPMRTLRSTSPLRAY
ncbi:MAG: hypothetical protein HND48_03570 [Chloroflexi bacterium]|nr:hypothetical protein [Chloroflexota bacterium]